ncbi:unsaturated rhamnogalacturonyl hydrolase [Mariniphaga anaerophila]|uniref:Unsaturated rhamnogalacturonyl hydrolase n=1 Tax=Mariniphaga anaerophila TaxID=1484053 RepID=A0A1M5BWH6_9BACT|nr:glycoside hydrolase family 88 protein [Mariniphaga anaerophila]SHF46647.1 unsaturated rhamnogalacturonyl hydrolase [Mariniphaga anaerophila]
MKTTFLLLFTIILGCSSNTKTNELYWATRFADATLHETDSLIYYQREKPKYEYDYAFLGDAIYKLRNIDPKYGTYLKNYIDYFLQDDGSIRGHKLSDYNIDRVRPGNSMISLYKDYGDEKYKLGIETLVHQMEEQPRTNTGGFWHKKVYPSQMWLDGLYMASPFLARYAAEFNAPKWFDEVAFQLQEVYKHTLDAETGLVYHAWDESREQRWCQPETGQSKHFWSRGTGWYMMALVDVLEYLPADHPERSALIKILNDLSEALLKVQDKEKGLWYQVLDMGGSQGNYIEASGSAMFVYAFAKGAKAGLLNKKYLEIANRAFDNIIKYLVVEGDDGYPVLTNTCGACGLGGKPYREADYNYYISEKKVDSDSKGVAPVILAAIELNK